MNFKAPRNRTIELEKEDIRKFHPRILNLEELQMTKSVCNATICADVFAAIDYIPKNSVDLVFADPPYNLSKNFGKLVFKEVDLDSYERWTESWVEKIKPVIKPNGSIYVCSEWYCSSAVHRVLDKHFKVQNRITWEREKGRGASRNWKNGSEDIWFCTMSSRWTFNIDKVKLKRKVIAPYTDEMGNPKDWKEGKQARFRETHPSNLWNDLTVPFWSMPENTPHPTQKPEKLLAKIILASSNEGDMILDPFLGSGTTSVVCKKLQRNYVGIEIDENYCLYTEKRLAQADVNPEIQGYSQGVFWERNTLSYQNLIKSKMSCRDDKQLSLFRVENIISE